MSTLTWLHLSDMHLRASHVDRYDAKIVLDKLLDDLQGLKAAEGLKPQLVFCTGDIAHSGKPPEYELAAEFFDRLLEVTDLSRDRVFVVPGNHDVDREAIGDDVKALADAFDTRKDAHALFNNPAIRRQMLARLDNYGEFFNSYFPKQHLRFDDKSYFFVQSFKHEQSDRTLAILGLNSAWLAYGDEADREQILVGEWQARAAVENERVREADVSIALLHHPFSWLKPFDEKSVRPLLQRSCDFILVGHRHDQAIWWAGEPDRDFVLIPAGASYEGWEKTNAYNLVRLDFDAGQGSIYLREFSPRADKWVEETRTYGEGHYTFDLPSRLMPRPRVPSVERPPHQERTSSPLLSSYVNRGIAIVLEASVVKVVSKRVEPLFNREVELGVFQRVLRGECPSRGLVVHSRGEPGWGKSSLLMMFCQQCSKCDPRSIQAFLFLNQEAPVNWASIIDITARRLGSAWFRKSLAFMQSARYARVGLQPAWETEFGYAGLGASRMAYRIVEVCAPEVSTEPDLMRVSSEQHRQQVTDLFLEELEALPEPARIVWLVDAVESADIETRTWLSNMLGRIARQQTHKIILVVAGRKPIPYDEAWQDNVCELNLRGLSTKAIRQIIESHGMSGTERTMEKLVDLLQATTSGNPLDICSYLDSTERRSSSDGEKPR